MGYSIVFWFFLHKTLLSKQKKKPHKNLSFFPLQWKILLPRHTNFFPFHYRWYAYYTSLQCWSEMILWGTMWPFQYVAWRILTSTMFSSFFINPLNPLKLLCLNPYHTPLRRPPVLLCLWVYFGFVCSFAVFFKIPYLSEITYTI